MAMKTKNRVEKRKTPTMKAVKATAPMTVQVGFRKHVLSLMGIGNLFLQLCLTLYNKKKYNCLESGGDDEEVRRNILDGRRPRDESPNSRKERKKAFREEKSAKRKEKVKKHIKKRKEKVAKTKK